MSKMLKSSGGIGAATLASRVLGLVREQFFAAFMGTTAIAGAFQFAFMIPNMFRRLLGEGALTAAFIPIFKAKEKNEGEAAMWQSANAVISGLLVLLLAGAYQMYRFSRALGSGEVASAMVALVACYHGGLNNLYYNSVFVFDVLCGIFFFAALADFARIRPSGRILGGGQTAAFLALSLCALNSKEMGITLPAVLLAYEWLFHGPPGFAWKRFAAWLRGEGRVIFWAGMLDLVFICGKRFGQYGLMKQTAYTPVISWERFLDFQERYIGDIFYHLPRFGWIMTLVIWAAVTYLAWRRKNQLLRFCWCYIVLTPLPLAFLIGRDQACLYVTLAGWAVLAGTPFEAWLPALGQIGRGAGWG